MASKLRPFLLVSFVATALPALAQAPLSASDWLSGSVQEPLREASAWRPGDRPPPNIGGEGNALPVASSAAVNAIEVTRLGHADPDMAGTIPAERAGLPEDLWQGSSVTDLRELILQTPSRLPATTALLKRILTAQLDPPADTGERTGMLFLARVDRMLDMGAVNEAEALLAAAGHGDAEVFRRQFDVALLKGDERTACQIMNSTPGIAPSFAARIFCLAQGGDWSAAAIGYYGAKDLGQLAEDEAQLLDHFLHDSYVDSGEHIVPPENISPLEFRIFEAIGQPLPTNLLPLAFAHSDLRTNTGWKARIEAAERLARSSAIPAERLRSIYAEQQPAASGGVWDRVAAMAELEAAIAKGDINTALPEAFTVFRDAGLAGILAAMMAGTLPENVEGEAAEIASMLHKWQGLAGVGKTIPQENTPTLPGTKQGEELLNAIADIDAGIDGDLTRAARGIAMLRAFGLSDDAELAAAQLSLQSQMGVPR